MYKIKNVGRRAMHVNDGKDTMYPDDEMEVEVLPENMTFFKVLSSPKEVPKVKKVKKKEVKANGGKSLEK